MTIDQLLALGTGLGNIEETRHNAGKNTCEIDDENQINEQYISSQEFHQTASGRVQKIIVGEQFKPRILGSFDPVTQD
jgi:phosphotransferase system IIB component